MNVYYLTTKDGHRFFYYDASESEGRTNAAGRGESKAGRLWAWAERKWGALQEAMDDPNGGVTRQVGRVWRWLHSFCNPDEAMHVQFNSADEVVLHYPASEPVDRVQRDWKRYLRRRARSRAWWAAVNAFVVPFAVLLAILPGPNVVGFWFVYRAVYHALGFRGLRRVRRGTIPTRLRSDESLDGPVDQGGGAASKHEALADGARLGEYLQWLKPSASGSGTGRGDSIIDV